MLSGGLKFHIIIVEPEDFHCEFISQIIMMRKEK